MVGYNPGTNQLDFGDNPDQDLDPRYFGENFSTTLRFF